MLWQTVFVDQRSNQAEQRLMLWALRTLQERAELNAR